MFYFHVLLHVSQWECIAPEPGAVLQGVVGRPKLGTAPTKKVGHARGRVSLL